LEKKEANPEFRL